MNETTACTGCGAPFFRAQVHACPVTHHLILPPGYVERQWPHLRARLEPVVTFAARPARHTRPMSGDDLLREYDRTLLGDYAPRHASGGRP